MSTDGLTALPDFVAQAFGFRSTSHLQQVLDGEAPSALAQGNPKWRDGVRATAARKRKQARKATQS